MKKTRIVALIMAFTLVIGAVSGCSGKGTDSNQTSSEKTVNIGTTDSLSSVNPLLMDASEILKYTMGLEFLPLVELSSDLEFEGALASSITTDDNIHFIVNIDKNATWSDGEPVTAHDVVYTVLKLASPTLANTNMALYAFEGFGDDGFVADGTTEVEGVKAVDDKTVLFTTKYEMALTTFENMYGRYILTLPKHILEDVAIEDLVSYSWFSAPTVVSGPYKITSYDLQHFVSYKFNDKYWKGVPKIENLNFKILTAAQLYTSLQSGEIDVVQQTTGNILNEDYESIEALDNVTVNYGSSVTNQSLFINTTTVADKRIRQAILCGINREEILSGILNGKGEVIDGFLSRASPLYDSSVKPVEYDADTAKKLVKEALADGWDSSQALTFTISSGDTTFGQAADYIVAQLKEIGINVEINTVDLSTLLDKAGSRDFDLMAIQYTYAPVDPYPDINWLLSVDGWTGYENDSIAGSLAAVQQTSDIAEITKEYANVDIIVQEDVPMISVYVISALGAVNNRMVNVTPTVYGFFNNVQEWDVK